MTKKAYRRDVTWRSREVLDTSPECVYRRRKTIGMPIYIRVWTRGAKIPCAIPQPVGLAARLSWKDFQTSLLFVSSELKVGKIRKSSFPVSTPIVSIVRWQKNQGSLTKHALIYTAVLCKALLILLVPG